MPAELRELRDEAPDGPGGCRHPDDVAVVQARHVEEPGVRGEAVPAEDAEIRLGWRDGRVELRQRPDPRELLLARLDHREVAPPRGVPDGVARREALRPRLTTSPTVMIPAIGVFSGNAAK